jgi:NADPH2:quinone reductase
MKAVILSGFGGPEVMRIGEADAPEPGPGQARIKVVATSVNRADIVQRQGHYPPPKGESEILGLEAAGVVETLGPGVAGWAVGDRVMSLLPGGGYAEYAVVAADHLIPVPDNLSLTEAAAVSEVYITAYLNVFRIGGYQSGETVLLHGGGGGVNTAAVQLCRLLAPGGTVIVTASPGKLERVRELGGQHVIDYRSQDFAAAVREMTANRGADVILDHIGAAYLEANLKALAVGGRLVVIGLMGGAVAELQLGHLMVKRQRIIGSTLRSRPAAEKAEIIADFRARVMPYFTDGSLKPMIHRVFPIEAVQGAHREMENSRHFGKIILAVGQ